MVLRVLWGLQPFHSGDIANQSLICNLAARYAVRYFWAQNHTESDIAMLAELKRRLVIYAATGDETVVKVGKVFIFQLFACFLKRHIDSIFLYS